MFATDKSCQPSLMFVDKARNLPLSGEPLGVFTLVGSGLRQAGKACQGQTFVHYGLKKF